MRLTLGVRHAIYASLMILGFTGSAGATDVAVCTDLGNFTLELYDDRAPLHAANFLEYVDRGYYTGTVFHRVISGFMVQGGGFSRNFRNKITLDPVMNESKNGLGNDRGTLAAARTNDPHSATSQFFVNLENNRSLDASGDDWGYTVFGAVSDGMEVIDNIAALPTDASGPFSSDVPDPLVAMTSMARVVEDRYPGLSTEDRHAALAGDIQAAINAGDNAAAAEVFGEYRAACGELGPDLLFTEAKVLAAVDRNAAAVESLAEYLRIADNTSEDYLAALSLSRELDPAATEARSAELVRLDELAADCVFPTAPAIPDARDTTMDDMVATQGGVQTYIAASSELLECLEEIADDGDVSDDDKALAVTAYNLAVQDQEDLAERWNEQRVLFMSLQ